MAQFVLCADDSKTMQTVAEITFRASEYEYIGARSADEALKLAKEKKPVIILADAVMPGKTGYDLCQAAKNDPALASIPVVLLCGNSQAYDASKGAEVGADAHMTKPWDSQVMLDKVKEVVEKSTSGVAKAADGAAAAPAPSPAAAPTPAATPAPATPAPASKPAAAKPAAPVAKAPAPRPATPAVKAPPLKPATPSVAKRPATPPPVAPKPATPAPRPTPAPAAAASDMRPPMIKGTPTKRPALPGLAGGMVAAAASADSAPRSATLMGMPSLKMPPGKKDIPGVTNVSSAAVAQAAVAAVPAAAAEAAQQAGLDPNGPEMQALVKLSTDVIERVVWEVVPDLAETIIRENLDKLTAQRS